MYSLTDLTIIDEFLEEKDFLTIKNIMYDLKWALGESLPNDSYKDEEIKANYNVNFVHIFYLDYKPPLRQPGIRSDVFKVLQPLLKKINPGHLLKVKTNLTLNHGKHIPTLFHTDNGLVGEGMTAIYYLNTCNGYTEFENGMKVESVENRIAIFPNSFYHRGVTTTNSKHRFLININWIEKDLLKEPLTGKSIPNGDIKTS